MAGARWCTAERPQDRVRPGGGIALPIPVSSYQISKRRTAYIASLRLLVVHRAERDAVVEVVAEVEVLLQRDDMVDAEAVRSDDAERAAHDAHVHVEAANLVARALPVSRAAVLRRPGFPRSVLLAPALDAAVVDAPACRARSKHLDLCLSPRACASRLRTRHRCGRTLR